MKSDSQSVYHFIHKALDVDEGRALCYNPSSSNLKTISEFRLSLTEVIQGHKSQSLQGVQSNHVFVLMLSDAFFPKGPESALEKMNV